MTTDLGEDRYLTTLLLKHFPTHKTAFIRDAGVSLITLTESTSLI